MRIHNLIYSVFLTLFIWQPVSGQPDSIIVPVKDSLLNKYGFVNNKDSSLYIISPRFDDATSFHNQYARVTIDSMTGLINKKGEFIFKSRVEALTTIHNGILVAKDSVFTILNFYGQPIVNFDFTSFYWKKKILLELPIRWEKEITENLNDSTIKDGELIARVLSMYQGPEIRFREMINVSMAYDDFAVLVLDYLYGFLEKLYGKEKLEYIKTKQYRPKNKE